ncbi:hypothetical protein AB4156_40020 [Cupriavidus sp. 2MCAB6]|uniref:hypothetical protein n=1 Tax=Cupriavidus sp. 2MCAB6 TaxID=3232981 RepID=UPI003F9275E7
MEIKIERPLRLHLDVVEMDEHVPSMKTQIIVEVQQFGHRLEYYGSSWFDCTVWDTFVEGLSSLEVREANLVDMGGHFVLRLGVVNGKPYILWEMKKVDVSGAISTATFRSSIDDDTFAHVKRQFEEF